MSKLFSPYQIKNLTLKNRIVMSPMCTYSSTHEDGQVNNWHKVHYASRAVGQAGLIFLESTAVTPQGRIFKKDLGIWSDDLAEGLKELVAVIREADSSVRAGIQISHAGRKSEVDGPVIAPSAIPYKEGTKVPQEMSKDQIKETIHAFREGARRAKEAGFDVIELHAAHGYLIHQFLSPLSNHREDEYGGSRDNRFRFLKEIIEEVKQVWDGPLFVRISANEYHPEGNTLEDYIYYSIKMKELGVDLIDCSSGAIVPAKIQVFPGYQVPLSEEIRRRAGIPTGAVGLITRGIQAEEILQNDRADLIFVAREFLRDPYWPLRAANELNAQIYVPRPYRKGWSEVLNTTSSTPLTGRWYPGKD
jgi:NADPH2 dehydrogenase